MNNTFLGLCKVGNFNIVGQVSPKDITGLVKRDNKLYGVCNYKEYELLPLDDMSELVVSQFSDFPGVENESIYELNCNKDLLVVMLYTFKDTKSIGENETMYFYLDRLIKNGLVDDGTIKNNDEVAFLESEFLKNRSVFIIEYFGGKATKTFQMYGEKYQATVERERPGIFRIKKIRKYKVNNRADEVVQFFGSIKFVTFDEACITNSNDTEYTEPQTHEIFRAWGEFLDFEKAIFDDEVRKLGYAEYDSYEYNGEEIVFHFKKDLDNTTLFSDKVRALDREYDALVDVSKNEFDSIDEALKYRDSKRRGAVRLGKCLNERFDVDSLIFERPSITFDLPQEGYILLSDKNIKNEQLRRKTVLRMINTKSSATSNMLLRLSAGEEDSQTGSNLDPLNSEVKFKMFGNNDVELKENFRKAMFIALNTPDIALIQGPPGTGKTTLINGIVARLTGMGNKNYKILVSSEQHEALYNVVDKLGNESIPPYVTSQKYGEKGLAEDEDKMLKNVENYQTKFLALCEDILNENKNKNRYSDELTNIIYRIQVIEQSRYDKDTIKCELEEIVKSAFRMDCFNNIKEFVEKIEAKINKNISTINFSTAQRFLLRNLSSQRLTKEAFLDDGIYQLNDLQRNLKRYKYDNLLIDEKLLNKLTVEEDLSVFDEYLNYVDKVKKAINPEIDEFELETSSFKGLFDNILDAVKLHAKTRHKDFYDIVEALKYRMTDIDNVKDIIMKYTNVIGSTCAQAERSLDIVDLPASRKYDFVIIDEAARANPLDLMIPVILGTKVIMVGDQMQLPHYIETDYKRRFTEEKGRYSNFDEDILTKSLFEVIYDSLEKSWNEGKLKFQRHIRIQEQHRMNPVIGNFISKQFYEKKVETENGTIIEGRIENGKNTINKINDYGMYDGKNVVWENIPVIAGLENRDGNSISRYCEAVKVIDILKEILRKNPNRNLKIGVMSFYKGQVELINNMLSDKFSTEFLGHVECNTVDSYQGKEFDIVILSTTRSNVEHIASDSLGFIYYSNSRINVALSRAKKLLIVVGDESTMSKSEAFENYIAYVKDNGYYGG